VKINVLLTLNAILFIGVGIAFALYGPLMITFFGILEVAGDSPMYWYAASFARFFGAAVFGFGFLLFALRGSAVEQGKGRGIVTALVISYLLAFIVAITQQVSIWGSVAGWITVALFLLLLVGYSSFLLVRS